MFIVLKKTTTSTSVKSCDPGEILVDAQRVKKKFTCSLFKLSDTEVPCYSTKRLLSMCSKIEAQGKGSR